jgi:hydrogenase maturation protein HypF
LGRLFDAVAALVGLRDCVSYEGQAAVELEWLAMPVAADDGYPFDLVPTPEGNPPEPTLVVDTRPLIRAVSEDLRTGTEPARVARRFHSTVVEMIAAVCGRIRAETGLGAVVLSGGVFLNALLTSEVDERLSADGFRAYRHRLVPPNDGGLSLGQLAVAAHLAPRQ